MTCRLILMRGTFWRMADDITVMSWWARWRLDFLLNRFCRRRSKKTSKLCVTSLCEGNSPVTGEFPAKRASNVENAIDWVSNTRLMQTRFRTSVSITSLYCCHDCTLACQTMPPANCMIHWHISLKGRMCIITALGFCPIYVLLNTLTLLYISHVPLDWYSLLASIAILSFQGLYNRDHCFLCYIYMNWLPL